MSNFKLIPFDVEGIRENIFEIPSGIRLIGAPSFWDEGFKGENIVVAVLDTGCQFNHPDLKGQIIGGYNFTKDYFGFPAIFLDNNGHGTHVCGTIAARENGAGVVGVAPKAKLLVLKVLKGSGEGTIESITSAIKYATRWRGPKGEKVRVISMSLGGPNDDSSLHSAIKNAVQNNIIVVCAAGNEGDGNSGTNEYSYPGAYPEVVEVGSVNLQQRLSKFSNSNSEVDLLAPGEEILSTYPKNQYAKLSGTSMAAPHVSGALALLIEKSEKKLNRPLTEPEIFEQLTKYTISLGYPKTDEGNGMLKLQIEPFEKILRYFI
ncbi:S8 family peptidase [Metabacillus sp. RGM 3146]|uniref:S8 family peptidase n=1 Tax=Metabacillus sp. RGM 3146 TaxID=3401092 RepID=UPI003B9D90BB